MKKKDSIPTAPPRKGKNVKLAAKMIVRDGAKHREALIAAGFTPRQAGKGAKGIALLHRGFRNAMSMENRRHDKELEMLGLNTTGETRAAIARGVLHNEAVNADASRDRISAAKYMGEDVTANIFVNQAAGVNLNFNAIPHELKPFFTPPTGPRRELPPTTPEDPYYTLPPEAFPTMRRVTMDERADATLVPEKQDLPEETRKTISDPQEKPAQ